MATTLSADSVLVRNNVNVLGTEGRTLLFAHGFGCDQNMWRFVAPAFEEEDQVVLFDHVGSGNSVLSAFDPAKYRTLHGYAQDVIDICDALGKSEVVFVGHSVSAMIGMLAAIRRPDLFSHLVLVAPSPCYINDTGYVGGFERQDIEELLDFLDSNYLGWSSALAPTIMGNPARPDLSQELENSFCRTDPTIAKHFARTTFLSDHRRDLPQVQVPALILQCADDVIAPLEVGEYMHRHLPHGTLVYMQATGHCPHVSAPEETIAAIRQYLPARVCDAG